MVNENSNNKKQHNTKQLKKKEYFCKRCGYYTLIYSNFKRHINRKTKCKRVSQKGGGGIELTLEDKRQAILKPYLKQFTNDLKKFQGDIKIIYLNKQIREYQRKLREDPKLFLNKKEITDEMNHFDLGLKMLNSILAKKNIQSELTNDDLEIEVKRIIVHVVEKEIVVAKEKDVQNGEKKVKEKISKDYLCINKLYNQPESDVLRDELNKILMDKTKIIETILNNIKRKEYDSIGKDLKNIQNSIKIKYEFSKMRKRQLIWHGFMNTDKYKAFNKNKKNYAEYSDRDNESTIEQLLFTLENIKYFNSEDVPQEVISYNYNRLTKKTTNNSQITIPIRVECTFNCRKAGYKNLSYSCEKQQEGCFIKKLNKPKDPKTGVKPT